VFHLRISLGVTVAEVVDVFRHARSVSFRAAQTARNLLACAMLPRIIEGFFGVFAPQNDSVDGRDYLRICSSTLLYMARVRSVPAGRRGSRLPMATNSTAARLMPRFCSGALSVASSVLVLFGSRMRWGAAKRM